MRVRVTVRVRELGLGLGLELGLGLGLRSCGEERKKPKGKVSIAELAATWWRLGG